IPHASAVVIESFREDSEIAVTEIHAAVYVEKPSQKGIIIGRDGCSLKRIGSAARREIQSYLNCTIDLRLWVRVEKNWRNQMNSLKNLCLQEE
ncbi:KH domain-containing protein, partial [bacterium]|nr:KH domain-containing protein [candidate division CSSED10-310 bacterium]